MAAKKIGQPSRIAPIKQQKTHLLRYVFSPDNTVQL